MIVSCRHLKEVLRLALPCIVTNITVPLLGLVDVAIVGHLGGASYIGAIAIGSMTFNLVYWLFVFLRMSTSGLTAQAVGAGDGMRALRLLRRSLAVALGFSLLIICLQIPFLWLARMLLNTPVESASMVERYFRILVWGAPAVLSLYSLSGWFVGMQDTRTPMVVSILQNVVNIGASTLLVFCFRLDIEGVAIGTLIAQWFGFLTLLIASRRMRPECSDSSDHSEKPHGVFSLSFDIFLRTLCLVAVNLYFTSSGARLGVMALAVNALLMNFFTFFSYFMDGFASAGEALVGKAYGASDREQYRHVVWSLFLWGAAMTIAFTVVYAFAGSSVLSLITSDHDVVAASVHYLSWAVLIPVAGVLAFVCDGIFIGLTATRGMLVSALSAMIVFFLLTFLLIPILGNHGLWIALLSYLAMRGLVQVIILLCSQPAVPSN